jgi:cytochrome c-type biogenesis protein CcmH
MMSNSSKLAAAMTIMVIMLVPAAGYSITTSEIEAELMCTCGCTMVLNTCKCGTSDQMRSSISGMIAKGMTKDEIIEWHVAKYSETVLAAPTRRGFNLIAYIGPWVGLLFGAGIAVVFVRRWTSSDEFEDEFDEDYLNEDHALSDDIQRKIDSELEQIEEG